MNRQFRIACHSQQSFALQHIVKRFIHRQNDLLSRGYSILVLCLGLKLELDTRLVVRPKSVINWLTETPAAALG